MIPKTIHRIWLDINIDDNTKAPAKYDKFLASFDKYNPEFKVEFWNMARVKKLFRDHPVIAKYQRYWETLPHHIEKCDMARFIILYLFGGIYVDLDFMCFKNLSPLLDREILLVCEPVEHSEMFQDDITCRICNGFIGSVPRHQFWLDWLDYIVQTIETKGADDVLNTTGPINFRRFFEQSIYRDTPLAETCDILPFYNDNGNIYVARQCRHRNAGNKIANEKYHQNMDNYVHTRWIEGSGWGAETLENYDNSANSATNKWWLWLILLIVIIITAILLYFVIGKPNVKSTK